MTIISLPSPDMVSQGAQFIVEKHAGLTFKVPASVKVVKDEKTYKWRWMHMEADGFHIFTTEKIAE